MLGSLGAGEASRDEVHTSWKKIELNLRNPLEMPMEYLMEILNWPLPKTYIESWRQRTSK
jgi:hypothetical protein